MATSQPSQKSAGIGLALDIHQAVKEVGFFVNGVRDVDWYEAISDPAIQHCLAVEALRERDSCQPIEANALKVRERAEPSWIATS